MMLHSVAYDPQGIILVKFQGPLTLAEVRQVMAEIGRLALEHQCFRLLTYTREMDLKLTTTEIYYLPGMFTELLSTLGLQAHQFKRAVIAASDDQTLQYFQAVSGNRGQSVKLLPDEESARRWLLET